jgi:hypothetical protein
MRTRSEVMQTFQDEDAESEMLAKHVKCIVHCCFRPNVNESTTAREAMGISVDTQSLA